MGQKLQRFFKINNLTRLSASGVWGSFLENIPPVYFDMCSNTQKELSCANPHTLSHQTSKSVQAFKLM